MGGSRMTNFYCSFFHETLPQRRGHGPEWKNREKSGGHKRKFWGTGRWKFFFDLQYLENGRSDFNEIFRDCGSHWAQSTVWSRSRWVFKFRGERGAKWPKMASRIAGGSLWAGLWIFAHREFLIFLRAMLAGTFVDIMNTFTKLTGGVWKNWGSLKKCQKWPYSECDLPGRGLPRKVVLFREYSPLRSVTGDPHPLPLWPP